MHLALLHGAAEPPQAPRRGGFSVLLSVAYNDPELSALRTLLSAEWADQMVRQSLQDGRMMVDFLALGLPPPEAIAYISAEDDDDAEQTTIIRVQVRVVCSNISDLIFSLQNCETMTADLNIKSITIISQEPLEALPSPITTIRDYHLQAAHPPAPDQPDALSGHLIQRDMTPPPNGMSVDLISPLEYPQDATGEESRPLRSPPAPIDEDALRAQLDHELRADFEATLAQRMAELQADFNEKMSGARLDAKFHGRRYADAQRQLQERDEHVRFLTRYLESTGNRLDAHLSLFARLKELIATYSTAKTCAFCVMLRDARSGRGGNSVSVSVVSEFESSDRVTVIEDDDGGDEDVQVDGGRGCDDGQQPGESTPGTRESDSPQGAIMARESHRPSYGYERTDALPAARPTASSSEPPSEAPPGSTASVESLLLLQHTLGPDESLSDETLPPTAAAAAAVQTADHEHEHEHERGLLVQAELAHALRAERRRRKAAETALHTERAHRRAAEARAAAAAQIASSDEASY